MSVTTVETFTCTGCGHRFEATDLPTACPKCRIHGSARTFPSDRTLTTARQNDSFRAGLVVGGCPFPGTRGGRAVPLVGALGGLDLDGLLKQLGPLLVRQMNRRRASHAGSTDILPENSTHFRYRTLAGS